ncbi:MAG: magnesium transporter, partial [Cyanobium sp.]
PAKVVRRLQAELSPAERRVTAQLLGYEPETAGRLMTTEFIDLKEFHTAEQALEIVRRRSGSTETIYSLYVTDGSRRLTGILSLRDLVVAEPEARIGEVMTREVISVSTDTDQEEVARAIQRYDFLAIPVVDREQRLVGIVTVDDVIDVIQQEATRDLYAAGAVQAGDEDDYFQSSLITVVRRRVVWLLVLVLANTLTFAVMAREEEILSRVVVLAAFIPLLIGTGGNVGAQSSTVVIRGLSTQQLQGNGRRITVLREAAAGLLLGLMLLVVVVPWAWQLGGEPMVAWATGVSLLAISVLAATAGAALPLLFARLGFDPALMSAPFITTVVDVLGVFLYLRVARLLLPALAIGREAIAGALLGLLMVLVVVPWAGYVSGGNWLVASAAGISLVAITTLAATAGAALPLLFARLGLDPALMSAPFIATATDVAGVFIYLQTASWLLTRLG